MYSQILEIVQRYSQEEKPISDIKTVLDINVLSTVEANETFRAEYQDGKDVYIFSVKWLEKERTMHESSATIVSEITYCHEGKCVPMYRYSFINE